MVELRRGLEVEVPRTVPTMMCSKCREPFFAEGELDDLHKAIEVDRIPELLNSRRYMSEQQHKQFDWRRVRPNEQFGRHVARPDSAGKTINDAVRAGCETLLVGGPPGVGKSSELEWAKELLNSGPRGPIPGSYAIYREYEGALIRLSRRANMRRLRPDQVLALVALEFLYDAYGHHRHDLLPSYPMSAVNAAHEHVFGNKPLGLGEATCVYQDIVSWRPPSAGPGPCRTLLIDGLGLAPPSEVEELLGVLGEATPRTIGLVVILPWHTFSLGCANVGNKTLVRPCEHFIHARAVDVSQERGRVFMRGILSQRIEEDAYVLDEDDAAISEDAIEWSGGIPRTMLQLFAMAGLYARSRGRQWPSVEDMSDAIAGHVDSVRRLLQPGDADAIKKVAGTSGIECDPDRRDRLLSHGILLERVTDHEVRLDLHPIAEAALASR